MYNKSNIAFITTHMINWILTFLISNFSISIIIQPDAVDRLLRYNHNKVVRIGNFRKTGQGFRQGLCLNFTEDVPTQIWFSDIALLSLEISSQIRF